MGVSPKVVFLYTDMFSENGQRSTPLYTAMLCLRQKEKKTRMWANAQRDGRPTEYSVGGAVCSTPQCLADAHY